MVQMFIYNWSLTRNLFGMEMYQSPMDSTQERTGITEGVFL